MLPSLECPFLYILQLLHVGEGGGSPSGSLACRIRRQRWWAAVHGASSRTWLWLNRRHQLLCAAGIFGHLSLFGLLSRSLSTQWASTRAVPLQACLRRKAYGRGKLSNFTFKCRWKGELLLAGVIKDPSALGGLAAGMVECRSLPPPGVCSPWLLLPLLIAASSWAPLPSATGRPRYRMMDGGG